MKTLYESIMDSDKNITQQTKEYADIVNVLSPIANAVKQTIKKFNCKIDHTKLAALNSGVGGFVIYSCKKDLDVVEFRKYLQDLPKFKGNYKIDIEFLDGGRFCWAYIIKDVKLLKSFNLTELTIEIDLNYVSPSGEIRVGAYRKKSTETPDLCNLFIKLLTE